jgi:hypothetical protein
MADEEEAEETFESTDAGSSHTYPMEGGQIRKGGYIMIKGNPCKVSDVSTSKTGKHGHAKCHFVALDIFTSRKMEELVPSSHNLEARGGRIAQPGRRATSRRSCGARRRRVGAGTHAARRDGRS